MSESTRDDPPARDKRPTSNSNIIYYQRRGAQRVEFSPATEADVLYIGDDTPLPENHIDHLETSRQVEDEDQDLWYIDE